MTHDDITKAVTASLEDRVRDAIKGVLEEVMQEEMTAQLQAQHREVLAVEAAAGERSESWQRRCWCASRKTGASASTWT